MNKDLLKRITRILVIGSGGLWLAWDLVAFNVGGLDPSISHVVPEIGCKYPQVILLSGVVFGHLFWPQKPVTKAP